MWLLMLPVCLVAFPWLMVEQALYHQYKWGTVPVPPLVVGVVMLAAPALLGKSTPPTCSLLIPQWRNDHRIKCSPNETRSLRLSAAFSTTWYLWCLSGPTGWWSSRPQVRSSFFCICFWRISSRSLLYPYRDWPNNSRVLCWNTKDQNNRKLPQYAQNFSLFIQLFNCVADPPDDPDPETRIRILVRR